VKQFLQGRYQIEFEKTKQMFNYLEGQLKKDALASVFKKLMDKVDQETEKYMQMDTNHDGKI